MRGGSTPAYKNFMPPLCPITLFLNFLQELVLKPLHGSGLCRKSETHVFGEAGAVFFVYDVCGSELFSDGFGA